MGILNVLNKLGCNHDWGYWEGYNAKTNDVNTLQSVFLNQEQLRACYEVRRCSKCKGYETRWVHDWRYDQDSVRAQREWSNAHPYGQGEYHGPAIMMECNRCGKRDPEFVVMGD